MKRLLLLVTIIALDQTTKAIAKSHLILSSQSLDYFSGVLRFQYFENRGLFLGLGSTLNKSYLFIILPCIGLALTIAAFFFKKSRSFQIGLTLIIGGGLGNIIDRSIYGYVIDFIVIKLNKFQTGVFNIADMLVLTGIIILTSKQVLEKQKKSTCTIIN